MRVESMELAAGAGKSRYWISFIDDKSRFGWMYFVRRKSDAPIALRWFLDKLRGFGRKLKVFVCDQDRVYLSHEFKKIINDERARIHNSPVYTGAGNAVAESFNKGIELKTVAMLRDGCAPETA
jgi:transposase InsO family protein